MEESYNGLHREKKSVRQRLCSKNNSDIPKDKIFDTPFGFNLCPQFWPALSPTTPKDGIDKSQKLQLDVAHPPLNGSLCGDAPVLVASDEIATGSLPL